MAVEVTLDGITPGTMPAEGWKVGYRIKGTLGAYIVPTGSPFTSDPIVFNTTDPIGTLYEGYIKCDCGSLESTQYLWETPCDCPLGYSISTGGTDCEIQDEIAPSVGAVGICLDTRGNGQNSKYGSRIYKPGFTLPTLMLAPGTVDTYIYGNMPIFTQWSNTGTLPTVGPMNRDVVWVDPGCTNAEVEIQNGIATLNGVSSPVGYTNGSYSNRPLDTVSGVGTGATASFTVSGGDITAFAIVNPGTGYQIGDSVSIDPSQIGGSGATFTMDVATVTPLIVPVTFTLAANIVSVTAKTVYLGVGAQQQFKVKVNGATIVDTGVPSSDRPYTLWHIIPISLIVGINYINLEVTGDGTDGSGGAMVVYDNTPAQILAASSDAGLNILFRSRTFRSSLGGSQIDVATCADDYSLDITGGEGDYTCIRTLIALCNGL